MRLWISARAPGNGVYAGKSDLPTLAFHSARLARVASSASSGGLDAVFGAHEVGAANDAVEVVAVAEQRSADWPGALRDSPKDVAKRENLRRGCPIRRDGDKPGGTSKLRGAPRSERPEPASEPAWVDAELLTWFRARAESKARGRRQGTGAATVVWDKPWRGQRYREPRSSARSGSGGGRPSDPRTSVRACALGDERAAETGRFGSVRSEKGTATVAKGTSSITRDPRPRDRVAGGSSGGPLPRPAKGHIARSLSVVWLSSAKPQERSGGRAQPTARSCPEQGAGGVETSGAQWAGVGIPARTVERSSDLPTLSGRWTRLQTLKGKGTP